jgi:hypothetical protein
MICDTYKPSSQLYMASAYLSALSRGMAPLITANPSLIKSSRKSPYVGLAPSLRASEDDKVSFGWISGMTVVVVAEVVIVLWCLSKENIEL